MRTSARFLFFFFVFSFTLHGQELSTRLWEGVLRGSDGAPIAGAGVHLIGGHGEVVTHTAADGSFRFPGLPPSRYQLVVVINGVGHSFAESLDLKADSLPGVVTLSQQGTVPVTFEAKTTASTGTGGERLSSETGSAIPLANCCCWPRAR